MDRWNARPGLVVSRRPERARTRSAVASGRSHFTPVALAVNKRGRPCVIAKLVQARPMNAVVLAMPYRNRQTVEHVSIPPQVLAHARAQGARWWVVRLDTEGMCFGLPITDVETAGWLKPSSGGAEWFVPLARFEPLPWQNWPFVEAVFCLGVESGPEPAGHQLSLFGA